MFFSYLTLSGDFVFYSHLRPVHISLYINLAPFFSNIFEGVFIVQFQFKFMLFIKFIFHSQFTYSGDFAFYYYLRSSNFSFDQSGAILLSS